MHADNLLTDPLFSVRLRSGPGRLDLPALLEALGREEVESLPALQRHQEDALHVFLCSLAASVLVHLGSADPVQEAGFWRKGIRALTEAEGCTDDSAWTLTVADWNRPAFMQPPAADAAAYSLKALTPDALDLLPSAKNHDLKSSRLAAFDSEDWVFALISLQTMSGVFGAGNYGVARMNGGYGSRAVAGLTTSSGLGGRFLGDVRRLLPLHDELLAGPWRYSETGPRLLWIPPWDGKSSLPVSGLAPFFIEICRAVRLQADGAGLAAWGAPTAAPRLASKELQGVLGDPWIPVKLNGKNGETALTVGPAGLSAQLLRDLIFEDGYRAAAMMQPRGLDEGGPIDLAISVLVRGQGTTEGFRTARLRIPARVRSRLFARGADRDILAELSRQALEQSSTMERKVLKAAVLSLLESGAPSGEIDWDRDQVVRWWQGARLAFTSAWSAEFFSWLWRTADAAHTPEAREESLAVWCSLLRSLARRVLDEAISGFPHSQARSYRARAMAEEVFWHALVKYFPELKEVVRGISLTAPAVD